MSFEPSIDKATIDVDLHDLTLIPHLDSSPSTTQPLFLTLFIQLPAAM